MSYYPYLSFAFWVIVLLLASMAVNELLKRLWGGRWARLIFFPALVVHQLSHLTACMLTGAKIHEVWMLDGDEAAVEHDRSKLSWAGEIVIALAPVAACGLTLWQVGAWMGHPLTSWLNLPTVDMGLGAAGTTMVDMAHSLAVGIWKQYLISWNGFLFLYFCVAFTTFMAPNLRDVGLSIAGVALFAGGLWIYCEATGGRWGTDLLQKTLWTPISFFVALQMFMLAAALVGAAVALTFGHYGLKSKSK